MRVSLIESLEKEISEKENQLDRIQKDIDVETEVRKELNDKLTSKEEEEASTAQKQSREKSLSGTVYKSEMQSKYQELLGEKTLVAMTHDDGTPTVYKEAKSNRGARMIVSRYEKENSNLNESHYFNPPFNSLKGLGGRSDVAQGYLTGLGLKLELDTINPDLLASAKVKEGEYYFIKKQKLTLKRFDVWQGELIAVFSDTDGVEVHYADNDYPLWDEDKHLSGASTADKALKDFYEVIGSSLEKRKEIIRIGDVTADLAKSREYIDRKSLEVDAYNEILSNAWQRLKKIESLTQEQMADAQEKYFEAEINRSDLQREISRKYEESKINKTLETTITKASTPKEVLSYFLAKNKIAGTEKQIANFERMINEKDLMIVGHIANKSNKASRQAFEYLTDLTLPDKDISTYLEKEWLKLSDAVIQERKAKAIIEDKKEALTELFDDLTWVDVRYEGKGHRLKDVLVKLINDGYDKIAKRTQGIVTYYTLTNGSTSLKDIESKYTNAFLKKVEELGGFADPLVKNVIGLSATTNDDKDTFTKAIKAIGKINDTVEASQEISKLIKGIEEADGVSLDMFDSEIRRAQDKLMERLGYTMSKVAETA